MAFTMGNYPMLTPEQLSPAGNLISHAFENYKKLAQTPYIKPTLQQELEKSILANQHQGLENKWYEPNIQSQIGLRGAQAGHLGSLTAGQNIENQYLPERLKQAAAARQFGLDNPGFGATGTSGDLSRLLYMQKMIQNNPEMTGQMAPPQNQSAIPSINPNQPGQQSNFDVNKLLQDAFTKVAKGSQRQFAPSNTLKDLQALDQAEKGINPSTQERFANEDEQRSYLDALREKTTGLPKGQHYVYDPETHEKIGVERPTKKEEAAEISGRSIFNEVMPVIRKADEFSGKGSIERFNKYVGQYGKNPESTQKIDDLLLAEKLLSATTVKEAATLGAGKQREVFRAIKGSLTSMDIPELLQKAEKGFRLPKEANIKASLRAQEIISGATQRASASVPATQIQYYHPEKHAKKEDIKKHLDQHEETIEIKNKKTGKTERVSIAEARKRGVPNV